MADAPWITIIGLGEDGPEGLPPATRQTLQQAEILMGPPRHLTLVPDTGAERIEWSVPFRDGITLLRGLQGRNVVVLASGDPFWFGAGAVIAREFDAGDWRAIPAPSTFSLAASKLGWALEKTICLGLHAAPLTRLRPYLGPKAQIIALLRDGAMVPQLANYLEQQGFGDSTLHVMEALGGPREKLRAIPLAEAREGGFAHPVCVGISCAGKGQAIPTSSGLSDDLFMSDGVMTKRPIRAVTLSSLAPRAGEHLWDIGGGSGSIAIEWLLSDPSNTATAIEPRADRVALIRANADTLGVDRLEVIEGAAPDGLQHLAQPDAVFIGGGLSEEMLAWLWQALPPGTRLVANGVTLEAETLLAQWHAQKGGELLRLETAQATGLGAKRAWKAAYPVVHWSIVL